MDAVNEFVLKKVLHLADYIAHRVIDKAGTKFENGTVHDVIRTLESDRKRILDRLASQQQSLVVSAFQYVQQAMSNLQVWSEEQLETNSNLQSARSTNRVYFKRAIRQLEEADKWAIVVFNDKNNSKHVRIEALYIRLFCRSLLDWDNKRLWFESWRQVFDSFFADRHFVKFALGKQNLASKLLSDDNAKYVSERFVELTKCLEALIWDIIIKDRTLITPAQEFAKYFNKYTTFPQNFYLPLNWSGLNSFELSYYNLTEDIVVKICENRLSFMMYEVKSMVHIGNGQIWAVDHFCRLVVFDANAPASKTIIGDHGKAWHSVHCAHDQKEVYALCQDHCCIWVFNPETREYNNWFPVPIKQDDLLAHKIWIHDSGIIYMQNCNDGTRFFISPLPQHPGTTDVFEVSNGEYQYVHYNEIIKTKTLNQWIGLGFKESFLIGDVLNNYRKNGRNRAVVSQRTQMKIDGLSSLESLKYWVFTMTDMTTCENSSIGQYKFLLRFLTDERVLTVDLNVQVDKDVSNGLAMSIVETKWHESFSKPREFDSAHAMEDVNGNLYVGFKQDIYSKRKAIDMISNTDKASSSSSASGASFYVPI